MTFTLDLATWGWPQWTMAIVLGLMLVMQAALHGQPRTGKYSFPVAFIETVGWVLVLGAAGFWVGTP
jgi:hypothetical protein